RSDPSTKDVRFVLVVGPGESAPTQTAAAGVDLLLPDALSNTTLVTRVVQLVRRAQDATAVEGAPSLIESALLVASRPKPAAPPARAPPPRAAPRLTPAPHRAAATASADRVASAGVRSAGRLAGAGRAGAEHAGSRGGRHERRPDVSGLARRSRDRGAHPGD